MPAHPETDPTVQGEPIAQALALLERGASAIGELDPENLSPEESVEVVDRLLAVQNELSLMTNRCIGKVDRTGASRQAGRGATSAWLTENARIPRAEAARRRRAGGELARLPEVTTAVESGEISTAMAETICAATSLFRKSEDVSTVQDALLGVARQTRDPRAVAQAGGHLRQLLGPDDEPDEQEREYRKRYMTVTPGENGGLTGWFYLPPEPANGLRALLDAYARPAGADGEDERTPAERNADVLIQIIQGLINIDVVVVTSGDMLPDDPVQDRVSAPDATAPTDGESNPPVDGTTRLPPTATAATSDGHTADSRALQSRALEHPLPAQRLGEPPVGTTGPVGPMAKAEQAGRTVPERQGAEWQTAEHSSANAESSPIPCTACGQLPLRQVLTRTAAVMLPTGVFLPAPVLRRRLATSTLYRVVHSQRGLEVSEAVRTIPPRVRKAVRAIYANCAYDDCSIPAHLCEVDHVYDWSRYQRSRSDELVPACDFHNRDRWRNPDKYRLTRTEDGRWRFATLR